MRPFKLFLVGFSVFLFIILLSVAIPEGKLMIGKLTLKFPKFRTTAAPSPHYKDITSIIKIGTLLDDTLPAKIITDTCPKKTEPVKASLKPVITAVNADSLKGLLRNMEYPASDDTVLFPFFRELVELPEKKKLIRIMHYGDSQIEGDRVTSYIRNQFQSRFGGIGIGLFPVLAVNPSSISYVYNVSDNWQRFSPQIPTHTSDESNKYGVLINYARIERSGGLFRKNKDFDGWIRLERSNIAYRLAQRFSQCRIFYGFNKSSMMVEVEQNKSVLDAEIVPQSDKLKILRWTFDNPLKDFTIHFKGESSPDVYGISLDGDQGVAVDNIPLRGSAGLEFTKSDISFLKNFYKVLNVKLLILQFGVNVVPNVRSDYDYYRKSFYQQLVSIHNGNPQIPIIVMGVSDVSQNGENGLESCPNIEKIRDAQKAASFDAGCAFWDVFEAMGGRNSMPSWVYANPPLAQKDFTHFSPIGAKIIGEMFYSSLMNEYNKFLKETKVGDAHL